MDQFLSSILSQLPVVGVFLLWAWITGKENAAERIRVEAARQVEREAWQAERKADAEARERMETRFEKALEDERKSRELQATMYVRSMEALKDQMTTYQEKFDTAVAVMQERTQSKTKPKGGSSGD